MNESATKIDHAAEALNALSRADYVRNADRWVGDREGPSRFHEASAQVHATLAVAEAMQTLAYIFESKGAVVTTYDAGRV